MRHALAVLLSSALLLTGLAGCHAINDGSSPIGAADHCLPSAQADEQCIEVRVKLLVEPGGALATPNEGTHPIVVVLSAVDTNAEPMSDHVHGISYPTTAHVIINPWQRTIGWSAGTLGHFSALVTVTNATGYTLIVRLVRGDGRVLVEQTDSGNSVLTGLAAWPPQPGQNADPWSY